MPRTIPDELDGNICEEKPAILLAIISKIADTVNPLQSRPFRAQNEVIWKKENATAIVPNGPSGIPSLSEIHRTNIYRKMGGISNAFLDLSDPERKHF